MFVSNLVQKLAEVGIIHRGCFWIAEVGLLDSSFQSDPPRSTVNSYVKDEMGRACSIMHCRDAKSMKNLVRKPEWKGPLRRSRWRWEDIIRWLLEKWGVKVWLDASVSG